MANLQRLKAFSVTQLSLYFPQQIKINNFNIDILIILEFFGEIVHLDPPPNCCASKQKTEAEGKNTAQGTRDSLMKNLPIILIREDLSPNVKSSGREYTMNNYACTNYCCILSQQ